MSSINRRQFCTALTGGLMPLYSGSLFSKLLAEAVPVSLSAQGNHDFVVRAPFYNPFYEWPRTLLSYPISKDKQPVPTGELTCVETGERVPFQIAAGRDEVSQSELLFFSALPAGATRTFRYSSAPAQPETTKRTPASHEDKRITIDLGPMQVRLPASQTITGEAPGPILELGRGGKWTGTSTLKITGHPIASIATEQTEEGPLRASYRITYTTHSGFKYIALVQCIAGNDFVRLHEDMEGLPPTAQGEFDFAWTGCEFAYRQSPNHPFNFPQQPKPSYQDYPWEAIAPTNMSTQFGVSPGLSSSGELPFSVRLYEPWTDVGAASFANFWSNASPHAAGIFIDHAEQWEDHGYAIWHASERVAVAFVYKQSTLHFVWKLARGSRSTCVSFYDHARDIEAMAAIERIGKGIRGSDGKLYKNGIFADSHMLRLQTWHGTLDLDKVKDWTLVYPKGPTAKPLFKSAPYKNAQDFYRTIDEGGMIKSLPLSGTRQGGGFGATGSRVVLGDWIPGFQVFYPQLTAEQKQRAVSMLLLMTYIHAGEDDMPMMRMLGGHPNFLADVKSMQCGATFLFPDHPQADTWADEWEAYLRLNTRYHTRPTVESWQAQGGRWTENLGTYVWAFLRPSLMAAFLLKARDGYQRFSTPEVALLGEWLVNALSAPFAGESAATLQFIKEQSAVSAGAKRHYWGIVTPADGPRRLHPPMGAHSDRRKTPRAMWYMGSALRNYCPLVAEHLMWAARPTDQDMETPLDVPDPFAVMYDQPDNRGTNPHLRSSKYTGYGITLRAAVDTPRELSVHLQQIDDGQNYRWGNGTEGTCGIVYFYANGKGYSHNGTEDAGDRIAQDADVASNFGVWKNGAFRSIGQNVLTEPMYDLEFAQFGRISARRGANAYSWPEYVSRSVLLAGDDYFILYDQVFGPQVAHRFSWFVRKGDAFPNIMLLTAARNSEAEHMTSIETETTSGRWADGMGDCIAVITHKDGIKAERTPYGGRVHMSDGIDLVFTASATLDIHEGANSFTGTSGIIRTRPDGIELALFHGTHIGAAGISLSTADTNLGISAKVLKTGAVSGFYSASTATEIVIGVPKLDGFTFYIDGDRATDTRTGGELTVRLPAGSHRWELTGGLPVPVAPAVHHTEDIDGGAIIHGAVVASAATYELELSADNASTWKSSGIAAANGVFKLTGLENGRKYHVRLIAANTAHRSAPGPEYPIYVTKNAPTPPEGLQVELQAGAAALHWGQTLGVTEYRLYRRKKGEASFRVVYTGLATAWKDIDPSIVPAHEVPSDSVPGVVPACQYYVTTVSHNGESKPSRIATTDPASWRNWSPADGGPYRRTFDQFAGALPNDGTGRYYPQ